MFKKILIANRGEIACRVMRTARRMGIVSVAVYSEADAHALHVRSADEAVLIGPPAARESYLDVARIVEAARRTGAEAIHPGYGFLSENAAFARACEAAGIVFIGPPAQAIEAMGSKSAAKALMERAGVPLTPGYHGDDQSLQVLADAAQRIGYPVLIKASSGGGGKGMRRVDDAADFAAALASCQREAAQSFGDDRVLVEKYVLSPRHIEMQVFADTHGNVIHLFERDCSVQRRHQKVLEEAPAPGMTAARREAMGRAAVEAARAVGYVGAGTVEFIAQQDGTFWFMEMNTRLQVEHPVTEMITGLDLVEWQLLVADGQALPLEQAQLRIEGHAVEARLYAENPDNGFLPSTGRLSHMAMPATGAHVRVDSGVAQGDEITSWYDPMIAKIIGWGRDRDEAVARLRSALEDVHIVGVSSNAGFLHRLVSTDSFQQARLDTGLIEREAEALFPAPMAPSVEAWLMAALHVSAREDARERRSPWDAMDGWRISGRAARVVSLRSGEHTAEVRLWSTAHDDAWEADFAGQRHIVSWSPPSPAIQPRPENGNGNGIVVDGRAVPGAVVAQGRDLHVFSEGRHWLLHEVDPYERDEVDSHAGGGLRAPMPGKVTALLVDEGASVAKGAALMIIEAMKMEHTIVAPASGTVVRHLYAVGDQVLEGAELSVLQPDGAAVEPPRSE